MLGTTLGTMWTAMGMRVVTKYICTSKEWRGTRRWGNFATALLLWGATVTGLLWHTWHTVTVKMLAQTSGGKEFMLWWRPTPASFLGPVNTQERRAGIHRLWTHFISNKSTNCRVVLVISRPTLTGSGASHHLAYQHNMPIPFVLAWHSVNSGYQALSLETVMGLGQHTLGTNSTVSVTSWLGGDVPLTETHSL